MNNLSKIIVEIKNTNENFLESQYLSGIELLKALRGQVAITVNKNRNILVYRMKEKEWYPSIPFDYDITILDK